MLQNHSKSDTKERLENRPKINRKMYPKWKPKGSKIEAKAEYDAVLGDGTLEGEALETVRQQVETITQEFGLGPAAAAVAT